jgi:hypothetical protein
VETSALYVGVPFCFVVWVLGRTSVASFGN